MCIELVKSFYYRILQNDTISSICKKFNTDKDCIIRNNPKAEIYAGEYVLIKVSDYVLHVVKPAETLKRISEKYKITEQNIIELNKLTSNKLYIGQTLKVPKILNF